MVVGQAAPWFREAGAIVDLVCLGYVLPCDWRTCGVVLGPRCVRSLFKFAFDCVYQFVHLFRDADCVMCLLLSVNFFVVVWRRYLKDGTEPSQALPDHVVLAVVVARVLSERWCVLVLFTFHVLADLTYLLLMECVLWCVAEGIALIVLFTTAFCFLQKKKENRFFEIVAIRVPKNHQVLGQYGLLFTTLVVVLESVFQCGGATSVSRQHMMSTVTVVRRFSLSLYLCRNVTCLNV